MPDIVPLPTPQMATVAPNWHAMRTAIAECERVDEIKSLSDKAVALRAYYAQSRDVDNEIAAMRIRLRAERRLGELIEREQEAGRLATQSTGGHREVSSMTTLGELGIGRDRSARAQELARVPAEQFEAALSTGRPSARKLAALAPAKDARQVQRTPPAVDVRPVLNTWGAIRDFAAAIDEGSMLGPHEWAQHPGIQQFQVAEIRNAIPVIVGYLTQLDGNAEPPPELPIRTPLAPPSNGMQFAKMAIMDLEKIRVDDVERKAGFALVRKWLANHA